MWRVTFNHTHRGRKEKPKERGSGRVEEKWDGHEEVGGRGSGKKWSEEETKEKTRAGVRKMENLSSLGSQQSAELNLTRKMTLHPLSHQSD